ncbi:MAG: hypothetical protein ACTSRG_23105, partial [Candidatus Helarchaeota archaeon]
KGQIIKVKCPNCSKRYSLVKLLPDIKIRRGNVWGVGTEISWNDMNQIFEFRVYLYVDFQFICPICMKTFEIEKYKIEGKGYFEIKEFLRVIEHFSSYQS